MLLLLCHLLVVWFLIGSVCQANEVDVELTDPALWLSAATFCPKEEYMTRTYLGPTEGFVATSVIFDEKTDTEGFIGYLPSEKTIFVVFRGSISARNWITDFEFREVSYDTYPECNCDVHRGFYQAVLAIRDNITAEVKSIQEQLDGQEYQVVVAGHSLGAALSHLAGMELYHEGIDCSVINFGMPRVGTADYAIFADEKISTLRYVHHQDNVPHLPPQDMLSYRHVCTEMYEDENGNVKKCNDPNCEDPTCGDQFLITQTNPDDHLVYLGLNLTCAAVS